MGGRAADKLLFGGDVSTGGAGDLQRATEVALEMVTRYGSRARNYRDRQTPHVAI